MMSSSNRRLALAVAVVAVSLLSVPSSGEVNAEPAVSGNAKLLVGVWAAKPSENLAAGDTLEFTADGKVELKYTDENQKPGVMNGTYTLDGTKITTTWSNDTADEHTITKLTASELETNDADGKQAFTRK